MACSFHQDPAHGLRSSGEEVTSAIPALGLVDVDQPKVSLMDQGCRLECLARLLLGQLLGRQLAQLVIDEG
jgi:hypothetical protein